MKPGVRFALAAAISFAVVAVGLGVVGGAVSYTYVKRSERSVRAGWNLAPVIVASEDIAPGTAITYDLLAQRTIPEQFVTASLVKPDSTSYLVGQALLVPVKSGEALEWAFFESTIAQPPAPGPEGLQIADACSFALAKSELAPPREKSIEDIRRRVSEERGR
jgi:hypothetical protein